MAEASTLSKMGCPSPAKSRPLQKTSESRHWGAFLARMSGRFHADTHQGRYLSPVYGINGRDLPLDISF